MIVQRGTPKVEGRYVAYIRCAGGQSADWVEPIIMTFASEKWHTSFISGKQIFAWMGPLPVMKLADLTEEKRGEETQFPDEPVQEYDL